MSKRVFQAKTIKKNLVNMVSPPVYFLTRLTQEEKRLRWYGHVCLMVAPVLWSLVRPDADAQRRPGLKLSLTTYNIQYMCV